MSNHLPKSIRREEDGKSFYSVKVAEITRRPKYDG